MKGLKAEEVVREKPHENSEEIETTNLNYDPKSLNSQGVSPAGERHDGQFDSNASSDNDTRRDRVSESENGWTQSLDENADGIKVVDGTKGVHPSTLDMTQTQGNNDLHGATDVRMRVIHQHIGTLVATRKFNSKFGISD
ncbi:hypothetical protein Tco_1485672 [Tanacetum coccineum]